MAMLKIKKGDMVRVIAGKDKNKEGRVLSVDAKKNRICPTTTELGRFFSIQKEQKEIRTRSYAHCSVTWKIPERSVQ